MEVVLLNARMVGRRYLSRFDYGEMSASISNRWVLLAAFLTATFMVAGAFALPHVFFFELAESSIFILIAVLVFLGENRFSYMLGIVFPPLWLLVDTLTGGVFNHFHALQEYLGGNEISRAATPLQGFARLGAIFLFAMSLLAWRKEAGERFWGRTFRACLIVSLAYVLVFTVWYARIIPSAH